MRAPTSELALRYRERSCKVFSVRSGRYLETFLMKATGADFSIFDSTIVATDKNGTEVKTSVICDGDIGHVIEDLATLVEKHTEQTAKALVEHGPGGASIETIVNALKSGAWPLDGDAATEAAAFAHHLLKYARIADGDATGVCWEYRGPVIGQAVDVEIKCRVARFPPIIRRSRDRTRR